MAVAVLLVTSTLNVLTAIGFALRRDWPMTLIWTCYGIANLGYVWGIQR